MRIKKFRRNIYLRSEMSPPCFRKPRSITERRESFAESEELGPQLECVHQTERVHVYTLSRKYVHYRPTPEVGRFN